MNKYALRKPFSIDGKNYAELEVDLEELSADDLMSVYDEHNTRRSGNPAYSNQNLPLLFIARANNLVLEDLRAKLKGRDFLVLMRLVDDFFTDTGLAIAAKAQDGGTPPVTSSSAPSSLMPS